MSHILGESDKATKTRKLLHPHFWVRNILQGSLRAGLCLGPYMFSWPHAESSTTLLLLLLSLFSRIGLCATPSTAAHQAPLSLGFSRQEHWSGLPFPSPLAQPSHQQILLILSSNLIPNASTAFYLHYHHQIQVTIIGPLDWGLPKPLAHSDIEKISFWAHTLIIWYDFFFFFFLCGPVLKS